MIYKKAANSGFITIEADLIKTDEDYVYLKCGKYLRKNIISLMELRPSTSTSEDLSDDA